MNTEYFDTLLSLYELELMLAGFSVAVEVVE